MDSLNQQISAKVVADSQFKTTRLVTLEVNMHRFILPEFNTHRSISRNFQSSRAIPVKQMIEQVRNNPAMPIHWGKNQSGMQAKEELEGFYLGRSQARWKQAAANAADMAGDMDFYGAHKQIVNRLLEPFMWTKGVVTATVDAWNAFFELRCHKDAQPEIQALAFKIRDAVKESVPLELKEGDWHTPYYDEGHWLAGVYEDAPLENAIKISTSCCGQVSYRKLDDSLDKALKIYDMLNLPEDGVYKDDPPHFSPTEHVAKASLLLSDKLSGNFHTQHFVQYRKVLEEGLEKNFIV